MPPRTARLACAAACLAAGLAASSGCTTARALRTNTIQQADTVADIHQQQVLDNLAKFITDPYAIPSFAYADAGTAQVTDIVNGMFGISLNRSGFSSASLDSNGSRNVQDSWTTVPVTDPRKIELMRCAYQRTISQCGCGFESSCCPDCRKRFNQFHTGRAFQRSVTEYTHYPRDPLKEDHWLWVETVGDEQVRVDPELVHQDEGGGYYIDDEGKRRRVTKLAVKRAKTCYNCGDDGRVANLVSPSCDDPRICLECDCPDPCAGDPGCPCVELPMVEGEVIVSPEGGAVALADPAAGDSSDYCNKCTSPGNGQVNSECLNSECCWLRWGCKKCVPEGCACVGRYGDTYVWVPRGRGRDELAKLTLAILDYAVNNAPTVPRKKVYALLDEDGGSTTYAKASYIVESEVSVDELSRSVVRSDLADAVRRQSESDYEGIIDTAKAGVAERVNAAEGELSMSTGRLESSWKSDYKSSAPSTSGGAFDAGIRSLRRLARAGDASEIEPGFLENTFDKQLKGVAESITDPAKRQAFIRQCDNCRVNSERVLFTLQALKRTRERAQAAAKLRRLPPPVMPRPSAPTPTGAPLNLLRLEQQLNTVR